MNEMKEDCCPVCGDSYPRMLLEEHVNTHFSSIKSSSAAPTPYKSGSDSTSTTPNERNNKECFCATERITDKILQLVLDHPLKTNRVSEVYVSTPVSHFATMSFDRGFGCGYRNIQMMLSYLLLIEPYRANLKSRLPSGLIVPTIEELQAILDDSWARGIDKEGANQLGRTVLGTRKWIGTTECSTLLRNLKIKTQITDFEEYEKEKDKENNIVDRLFDWVWKYFHNNVLSGKKHIAPLYFQQQGHSRTIIGVEKRNNNEIVLLILDPSFSKSEISRTLFIDKDPRMFRRSKKSFHAKAYQIVSIVGLLP